MEAALADIASDLHEVRPEYIEKLKRIEKEGTISKKGFEDKFGVKLEMEELVALESVQDIVNILKLRDVCLN